jgi:5'-nucleotidase/UDP-sugar diphosphatase
MKNLFRIVVTQVIVLICLSSFVYGQSTTITILHVNDTHSHLDAVGPKEWDLDGTLGGIAKAAAVIKRVRATEENVLLLHAGDVFQGDLFFNKYFGVPEFQLMLQLGFDAMTVGNHEFDFGPGVLNDVLTTAFAQGSFPLLSANLDNLDAVPGLSTWIRPSIVKTVGGVKIGIFGMTVPNDPTNMPAPVIIRDDLIPIAQQMVDNLHESGAEVVICLSHLGFYNDNIVAAGVSGIDFIIGAHNHFLFEQPVPVKNPSGKTTLIFQAGEHYKYIGKLRFYVKHGKVYVREYHILPVDRWVRPDPTIAGIVNGLKAGIVAQYGDVYRTVVGFAKDELAKKYDPKSPLRDTPLGNLVTDAFRKKTGTDIAITPDGLISEKIYAGRIVGADVFRAVSYGFDEATGKGFTLATLDLAGAELVKGLEVGLSQIEVDDDFFLQVSGMSFNYDPRQPVGQRVNLQSIRINGDPIDPTATYSLTVNTGVVALLDFAGVHAENIALLPDFEYDVVRDYIKSLGVVRYRSEGRIRDNSVRCPHGWYLADAASVPPDQGVRLYKNYPNPFNPSTRIAYELPVDSRVSLKVYNTLGQEVATLVNGENTAGRHEVVWDASNVPSGVYFYRIEANGASAVEKLLLLK